LLGFSRIASAAWILFQFEERNVVAGIVPLVGVKEVILWTAYTNKLKLLRYCPFKWVCWHDANSVVDQLSKPTTMIDQTPGQPYVISTFQQHIVPLFPLGRLRQSVSMSAWWYWEDLTPSEECQAAALPCSPSIGSRRGAVSWCEGKGRSGVQIPKMMPVSAIRT
jgi:hypothetical protein